MYSGISTVVDILNGRLLDRDQIYLPLQNRLAPTPLSTKQSLLTDYSGDGRANPVFGSRIKPHEVIQRDHSSNVSDVVDIESILQNRFFALQRESFQSSYVPPSSSDLYYRNSAPSAFQTNQSLPTNSITNFSIINLPEGVLSEIHHPNINLGRNIFNNNTRIELKNLDGKS
jgi:hypothetical protein